MKKGDLLWLGALGLVVVYLLGFTEQFNGLTKAFPYPMGFLKFFVLATMGELLAIRIVTGDYKKPVGLIWRAVVWGLFGMVFVFIFPLFAAGVKDAAAKGLLPKIIYAKGLLGAFGFAFFTSMIMNLAFAPTFMALHRVTDTYIDMGNGNLSEIFKQKMNDVVGKIDWRGFVSFVVCKTLPFFWIPAHTITFLLPPEYRILMAAFLGIALGGILAFAKRRAVK